MGWASGSELADKIWNLLENRDLIEQLDDEVKAEIALEIMDIFEQQDCDTMDECDFVNEFLKYNETTEEWESKK